MARKLRTGTLIDHWKKAYVAYQASQKATAALNDKYKELSEQVFQRLKEEDTTFASGVTAAAKLTDFEAPHIDDYNKFEKFVLREKALDLFNRNLNRTAYADRLKARKGRPIPGLKTYKEVRLSRPLKPKQK
jgi:hypothetical protein